MRFPGTARSLVASCVGWRLLLARLLWLLAACSAHPVALAAEPIPPKPSAYFNDYAGVVSSTTASELERRLAQFERDTSCQVLVAIYKKIPGDYALEDFSQRTAEAWGVGRKKESNGVVLFVFTEPRLIRIEVGYGLEGALPDVLAGQIIANEIRPAFRAGNYDQGITRGVDAILRATQGEYKGAGRTANDSSSNGTALLFLILFLFALFAMQYLRRASAMRRGTLYGPRGRRGWSSGGGWGVWPGGGGWGGGGGGGWGGGGGGGGFSGGGGSFGGGGASGGW
jgi:uncharacterized protein